MGEKNPSIIPGLPSDLRAQMSESNLSETYAFQDVDFKLGRSFSTIFDAYCVCSKVPYSTYVSFVSDMKDDVEVKCFSQIVLNSCVAVDVVRVRLPSGLSECESSRHGLQRLCPL